MRNIILFDMNETVLDLSSLKPDFEMLFGDSSSMSIWFATLLHNSTVCALTNVAAGFASLASVALDKLAAKRGVTLSIAQRDHLMDGFANLQPHCDVIPALAELRRHGYRTVAFSNSSRDLMAHQIQNAGLFDYFDHVISVEQTGSFKPDPKVYQFAAKCLARTVNDLRLIATHDWDTHGALSAGMHAAYIDRSGAPYHPLLKCPSVFSTDMQDLVMQIMAQDA